MNFERSSGLMMHPTSLPGRFGIGDLGKSAYRFVDFLEASKQTLWQIMPLGPTGYGDSPYQALSSFAGNPLIISLEQMQAYGMISGEEIDSPPQFPDSRVDYGAVIGYKIPVLKQAYEFFDAKGSPDLKLEFQDFCNRNGWWLEDFALYMALKESHNGAPWFEWEWELASRDQKALEKARNDLKNKIETHKFIQFVFFRQWYFLRSYANSKGIKIIGDIPIYVAYDSCDAWSHPEILKLDDRLRPIVVAGVPPDLYSETGQLWGNPVYRWDVLAETGYAWWIDRFRMALQMVDIVRLDHFRGFEAFWEVPAGESTAVNGRWVKGPGEAFFEAVFDRLGEVPIIVEDLGFMTPEVDALREKFGLPGMKVLQFAFGGDSGNVYLPHNYPRNCVVYTSTHDSDTARGWFEETASEEAKSHLLRYAGCPNPREIHWEMIRLAWRSVANIAMAQTQDVLGLDNSGRMNLPGSLGGNWSWRMLPGALTPEIASRLAEITELYGRDPGSAEAHY